MKIVEVAKITEALDSGTAQLLIFAFIIYILYKAFVLVYKKFNGGTHSDKMSEISQDMSDISESVNNLKGNHFHELRADIQELKTIAKSNNQHLEDIKNNL